MPTLSMNASKVLPCFRALRLLAIFACGILVAPSVIAHDFWIEPTSFSPVPGHVVAVRLLVGEHFIGEAVARPPLTGMHRFVVVDADSNASATLPGRVGADPAGRLRLERPGVYIIGFHGKPNPLELPAEKFNTYLKDEGLESVLAVRAARGQMNMPGREIYSRCAKSLMIAGPADADRLSGDRALGFALELVAERQPDLLRGGDSLPVRLLLEGEPLAGALVVALHRDDPNNRIALRSDADGRVFLPLNRGGQWLVKAVHMHQAPSDSGADWESLWASLTFSSGAGH